MAPDNVVEGIRKLQEEFGNPKVVVRPSGTEPIVRIYVEAPNKTTCDEVAERLKVLLA